MISTQHDDFDSEKLMLEKINQDIKSILIPRIKSKYKEYSYLFNDEIQYHINPPENLSLEVLTEIQTYWKKNYC